VDRFICSTVPIAREMAPRGAMRAANAPILSEFPNGFGKSGRWGLFISSAPSAGI